MESVALYSEARSEYLKQIATWLVPPLVAFFRQQWDGAVASGERVDAMRRFQDACEETPKSSRATWAS
jgi:hypothetical protein